MTDLNAFKNPAKRYRVFPMTHYWMADYNAHMDAYRDYGYGGAVTNVPFAGGFTSSEENLRQFAKLLDAMEAHDLGFWIYDEDGYPSGQGGGLVLNGHPELRAKGFYMVRRIAYEAKHVHYHLDDVSDKIVWAAKYPLYIPRLDDTFVQFDKMEAIPFTDTEVICDLAEREILFIFCVKDAHEGSHSTHNVSSFKNNINVMDKRAVKRFLDLCFEPIANAIPDAYKRAVNVFTDEPSLHTSYARDYETWNYALAPWVDGLFEAYEAEYGESMLPTLPLLFEGGTDAYPVRIKFYELVGKLVSEAYSGQISAWCEAHGGGFSGHYVCEEAISQHVMQYGNYVRVVSAASYPGIDVLCCYPEIYDYNTAKYAQMVVRKKQTNGMMVEICPFADVETFRKDPLNNMTAVMGLLYLAGVRRTNSYFGADFSAWRGGVFPNAKGYTDQAETVWFNEYVGRLGAMLDGLHNECDTFIYYPLEDAQAKMKPAYCGSWQSCDRKADEATGSLSRRVYEAGHDYYFIDRNDILDAAQTAKETGVAMISGCKVKNLLLPGVDVMYGDAYDALKILSDAGVNVVFCREKPRFDALDGGALAENSAPVLELSEIISLLNAQNTDVFRKTADGATVLRGKFITKEGKTLYMFANKSRTDAELIYNGTTDAEIWNPSDGSVKPISAGATVIIPAMRALFVLQ
ncbi:MAG: hypothetical protein IIX84_04615 [Oscillospiraceae bacterium]|nr:hypothetical protein [Oscillospiraceae bacterium]